MVSVSIVEDDAVYADVLKRYLARYQEEYGTQFQVSHYTTGADFLEHYTPDTDLVFMDIELPGINGMDTAISLRKVDQLVALVFITNLTQYAIQGYSVDAEDYIIKPVTYAHFAIKLERVLQRLPDRHAAYMIRTNEGLVRVACDRIYYVESLRHKLLFHTADGDLFMWGTLSEVEADLRQYGFSRPSKSFLVNMRHIQTCRSSSFLLRGQEFSIGRSRKAAFLSDVTAYLGGTLHD